MGDKGDFDIGGTGGGTPRDDYVQMNVVLPADFPTFEDGAGEIEEIPAGLPDDGTLYYFQSSFVFNTFPGTDGFFGFSNDVFYNNKVDSYGEVVASGDYFIDFATDRVWSYDNTTSPSYVHICERQIEITASGPLIIRSITMVAEIDGADLQRWGADQDGDYPSFYPEYKDNITDNAKFARMSYLPGNEDLYTCYWSGNDGGQYYFSDDGGRTWTVMDKGCQNAFGFPPQGACVGNIGVYDPGHGGVPALDGQQGPNMTPRSDLYPAPLPAANPILWGGDQVAMISYDYGRTWLLPPQWTFDLPYCNFGAAQWSVGHAQGMVPWDIFSGWSEAMTINRDNGRVYLVTLRGTDTAIGPGYRGMYGALYVGFDFWGGNYGLDSTFDPATPGPLDHLGFPGNNVLIVGGGNGLVYRLVDSQAVLNPFGDKETCIAPFAANQVLNVTGDPDFAGATWRLKLVESFLDGQFVIVYRMHDGSKEIFKVYRSYDYGQSFSYHSTLPTHSQAANRGFGQLLRLNFNGMWAFFTNRHATWPNPGNYMFISDDDMATWTRVADFVNDTFTFAAGSAGGKFIADFSGYPGRALRSHRNTVQIQNTFTVREADDYTPVIRGVLVPSSNANPPPLPSSNYYYGWVVDMELGRTTVTIDKVICDESGFVIRAPHVNTLREKLSQLNSNVITGGTEKVSFGIDVANLDVVTADKDHVRAPNYEKLVTESIDIVSQVGTGPSGPFYTDGIDLASEYIPFLFTPVAGDAPSIRTLIAMRKILQNLYTDGFFCACYSYCPCQTDIQISGGGSKK